MSLDITAYRNLRETNGEYYDDEGDIKRIKDHKYADEAILFYINPNFPGMEVPIKQDVIYTFSEKFDFRAGSYSGYNWWREKLATLCSFNKKRGEGAFYELIWFSDCEGVIGGEVSKKLLKDFQEWESNAMNFWVEENNYFFQKYQEWMRAFELAADNGAVRLH